MSFFEKVNLSWRYDISDFNFQETFKAYQMNSIFCSSILLKLKDEIFFIMFIYIG